MSKAFVTVLNNNHWPMQCDYVKLEYLSWAGKWHLIGVDCFKANGDYVGEYPRWAIDPAQCDDVEWSKRFLPPLSHP